MGQTVSRLLGSKRLDVPVPEGIESHYRIVDRVLWDRRVRLEFTVLYPKEEEEEEEEERHEASRVVIEEVNSMGGEEEEEQQVDSVAVSTTDASIPVAGAAEDE